MGRQLFYHVYQRSLDKSVVFKTSLDALVFVSILFVKARCYKVSIPALCLMENHFHILARVHSESSLDPFVSESVSLFTRLYNKEHLINIIVDDYGLMLHVRILILKRQTFLQLIED